MKEQLIAILENSRNYTIGVAEAMPENLYNSKPTDGVWNFGELMHHIAYGILWWEDNYVKKNKTEWNPSQIKNNKQQIIAYLNQSYDSLKRTMGNGRLDEDAVKGFYATLDHATHHRGQAVLHLRCQGIAPPEYIF